MDQSGQTYFEDEDKIPQEDLDRMCNAKIEELRRLGGERIIHSPKALARIENVGSETYGSSVPE